MSKASIIIRTKNEERWISRCLAMIAVQTERDYEIILIDNESTDSTVQIAQRLGVKNIISINEYLPGKALNAGAAQAVGEYLVCLSAHCLPKNEIWLATLLDGFKDPQIAGIYGRQIPVSFSSPSDKRDLLITFGRDRRVQVKDYFFHNANSALRRSIWQHTPFDDTATNIEDRIWAKKVLERNYRILYEPEAVVYHHHGIHQNNEPKRAQNVISIIQEVEGVDDTNFLPDILQPETSSVAALIPIVGGLKKIGSYDLLAPLLEQLRTARYIKSIFVMAEAATGKVIADHFGIGWIDRERIEIGKDAPLDDLLRAGLLEVEQQGMYPDTIAYTNYLYPFRPQSLFDDSVVDLYQRGLDTVFPASLNYSNYWIQDQQGNFRQMGDGLKPREQKDPLYQAHYGLGTITTTATLRSGKLIGSKLGIIPIKKSLFTHKYEAGTNDQLMKVLVNHASQILGDPVEVSPSMPRPLQKNPT